jgi:RNase P subunit RPR2
VRMESGHIRVMPKPAPFYCPHCAAKYEMARIESPSAMPEIEITCLSCGEPLRGREGAFLLKYFLVERPGEHRHQSAS